MTAEYFDIVIIGAGLSGIGAATHLSKKCPDKTFVLLESRDAIGGTWDLFRYPGIRSDSDMYTLGYNFKPWNNTQSIADGHSIRNYIEETAEENNIKDKIRFGLKVISANWDSANMQWTVTAQRKDDGSSVEFVCPFIFSCSGYYNYDQGYTPEFPGQEAFKGQIIHPQHWPEDLDYAGKKVVVIGSGATAITLIPSMAVKAGHITMLQRSPTYVLSRPADDKAADWLRKILPDKLAYDITRWKYVFITTFFYQISRRQPKLVKKVLRKLLERQLGNKIDIDKHFTPHYDPWDQRVCVVPNSDLFRAIRKGKASVATDHIDTFTENGIALKSGEHLDADIIVTATGLNVQMFGGMALNMDGEAVRMPEKMGYKGMMFEDIPNFAVTFGYTNASWTLKADLVCEYVCRLLKYMDKEGFRYCMPVNTDESIGKLSFIDLESGYIQRVADKLPKQGDRAPWRLYQNYALDMLKLRFGTVTDGVMHFYRKAKNPPNRPKR